MPDSWNDLTTADTHTPEFLNSLEGGGDFVDEPPIHSTLFFFTYIAHAVGHRPQTPYRINPFASLVLYIRPAIYFSLNGSVEYIYSTLFIFETGFEKPLTSPIQ
jgi:hypothetical protein